MFAFEVFAVDVSGARRLVVHPCGGGAYFPERLPQDTLLVC